MTSRARRVDELDLVDCRRQVDEPATIEPAPPFEAFLMAVIPPVDPLCFPSRKEVTRTCALIMKGGITSGVVYPPAILELQQSYRFQRIGGASAGSLAATVTAAAEFGRDRGGFAKLQRHSERLAQPGKLRTLFQPEPQFNSLFQSLLELVSQRSGLNQSTGSGFWTRVATTILLVVRRDTPSMVRGLLSCGFGFGLFGLFVNLIILIATAGSETTQISWTMVSVMTMLIASLGALIGALIWPLLYQTKRILQDLPQSDFGLCSGRTIDANGPDGPLAVTDWLHTVTQDLAGLELEGPPLTFEMLSHRDIKLISVVTNLTLQRPVCFPLSEGTFADRPRFFFDPEEMRRLFPEAIVSHMIEVSTGYIHVTDNQSTSPRTLLTFPEDERLPVVVAARMSLSFPILFQAVPLYVLTGLGLYQAEDTIPAHFIQRVLFSDGGICSNFPIHIFDDWLPDHPTFAINLSEVPDSALHSVRSHMAEDSRVHFESFDLVPYEQLHDHFLAVTNRTSPIVKEPDYPELAQFPAQPDRNFVANDVMLPDAQSPVTFECKPISALSDLLKAIFATAQNHHDNRLAELAGHRERIVRIRFRENEGGMNLAMPRATIRQIMQKGRRAGRLLSHRFQNDHHRWVRLLALLAELDGQLLRLAGRLRDSDDSSGSPYRTLLGQRPNRIDLGPFPRSEAWRERALAKLDVFLEFLDTWQADSLELFQRTEPMPEPRPVLRPAPND